MTATCRRAIESIRECAKLNIKQAKAAKAAGRVRMAAFHANVALSCRRDSNLLRTP